MRFPAFGAISMDLEMFKRDSRYYGSGPISVTPMELDGHPELMFVQDMPIKMAWGWIERVPENLKCFLPLIEEASDKTALDEYLYINAKHIYFPPGAHVNRPGWHSDSYGHADKTWLWYDSVPTEFCRQPFALSMDDKTSMQQMEEQALFDNVVTYPCKNLIYMDDKCIHRPAVSTEGGFRIFVKLVTSKNRFNLKGNAHNYLFDYDWELGERGKDRNLQQAYK